MTRSDSQHPAQPPAMRSLFCVATTFVTPDDEHASRRLGQRLYDRLTRDHQDPLSFGAGIPVAINVDIQRHSMCEIAALADHVLLIFVAGPTSLLLHPDQTTADLSGFGMPDSPEQKPKCQLSKMLVPTDGRWPSEAPRLGEVVVSKGVFDADGIDAAIDSVLMAIAKILRGDSPRPRLLINDFAEAHPKLGTAPIAALVGKQRTELWDYFSEVKTLQDGDYRQTSDGESQTGVDNVFVCLHGDRYRARGERRLHDRELLAAQQRGWPIVQVPAESAGDWNAVLRLAAGEHLRQLHFRKVAERMTQSGWLPIGTPVLSRPPELVDLSSGPLRESTTRTVLHPDPALTPEKRDVLRAAAPLLHPITPSTLLGRTASRDAADTLITPLDGMRVGLSVSRIPEGEFQVGQTDWHLQDATVQLTRTLIGGGATLTYGGNFVVGQEKSFTPLLAELIQAYNQTAQAPAKRLQVFQALDRSLDEVPADVLCRIRHLGLSTDLATQAVFSEDEIEGLPSGMLVSDMRRAMAAETDARVAIGGQSFPRDQDTHGYSGRFPGIAEEVYRALEAGQPVYPCGGFGGITARIVQLWEHPEKIDSFWRETTYDNNRDFVSLIWNVDNHHKRAALELPANLTELAHAIAAVAIELNDDDQAWINFNGLTYRQNQTLWRSTDPILLSSLIAEGLLRRRSRHVVDGTARSKIRIEAMLGNINLVSRTDLLALAVFKDVDPQGAGAAIDRVTGGLMRQAQAMPGKLLGVRSDQLDVDYLCAVSLGDVTDVGDDPQSLKAAIKQAVMQALDVCHREGFRSLAVVTFGGSSLPSYEQAVKQMLSGFRSHTHQVLVKWIEADEERYAKLLDKLQQSDDLDVTTVRKDSTVEIPQTSYPWFQLTVKYRSGHLDVTALAREGTGRAWSNPVTVRADVIEALSEGIGDRRRETPNQQELTRRGKQLVELLFGEQADVIWQRCRDVPIAITHDAASSKIPFEIMQYASADEATPSCPAVNGGIHRWLAVRDNHAASMFARPRLSRKLRVGLIVDPTKDLPGARTEGEQIHNALATIGGNVQSQYLGIHGHPDATLENVVDMLRHVDVLHYCGHAKFDSQSRERSGLLLFEDKMLTADMLHSIEPIPRVVIFNACEAGRVRGEPKEEQHQTFSLAEMMLRAGVEAFLGTFWEVNDKAAEAFAKQLYSTLTEGQSLRAAVTAGRAQLAAQGKKDWANYILYGDGRFCLA
ncbi:CHAT domain-containing protein [Roseimaritima ulvae]|uniref:CHAT domain protein n=1 Tax=Roseimaritima ulvae TaxID=980254 RepID=A0A5B9QVK3_9BACT|nr:CHAT domain-containing protein [Roseimaritima ulvae]QEG41982.1 CHAT domain protein [Roseimaritima ulvae]